MSGKLVKRAVVRVTRSPMNPLRWALDLECGHEEWCTSKNRPVRKTVLCEKCREAGALPQPGEKP